MLFVCRHGAAKSVLAASVTAEMARARGVAIRTAFGGVEPQERMSPAVIEMLGSQSPELADQRPRKVTAAELERASRVVTFSLDDGELPAKVVRIDRWDDVPAVADDAEGAKAAIERHVAALLAEIGK